MSDMLLIGLIATALLFDFLNGLHDAANSIATIVSTRVLSPRWAVLWAAFFNFIAFLVFGLSVAKTIGPGIVQPQIERGLVKLLGQIPAVAGKRRFVVPIHPAFEPHFPQHHLRSFGEVFVHGNAITG